MSYVKIPMGRKISVILSVDVLPNIDGTVTGEQWTGKGHGRKQSGPNQVLSWHLPGRCDKTTSHLRIANVPIKVLAGHFPNTSHCHTDLLGLYKLLPTAHSMTTSE